MEQFLEREKELVYAASTFICVVLFIYLFTNACSSSKKGLPPRSPSDASEKKQMEGGPGEGAVPTSNMKDETPVIAMKEEEEEDSTQPKFLCKKRFSFRVDRKYQNIIDDIVPKFYNYINSGEEMWSVITKTERTTVWKHHERDFCYKIEGVLDATPGTIINHLFDVSNRPKWDNKVEQQRVLEQISPMNRIIYVQTKPIWPCSARDMTLFSYIEKIENGGILNVSTRYDHESMPSRESEGIVRAYAGIAGQIFRRHPTMPGKTVMVQIADVDIRGTLPKTIVKIVTETVLPNTVAALNKQVFDKPVIDDWYPPGSEALASLAKKDSNEASPYSPATLVTSPMIADSNDSVIRSSSGTSSSSTVLHGSSFKAPSEGTKSLPLKLDKNMNGVEVSLNQISAHQMKDIEKLSRLLSSELMTAAERYLNFTSPLYS
jgi:hypothetical protein